MINYCEKGNGERGDDSMENREISESKIYNETQKTNEIINNILSEIRDFHSSLNSAIDPAKNLSDREIEKSEIWGHLAREINVMENNFEKVLNYECMVLSFIESKEKAKKTNIQNIGSPENNVLLAQYPDKITARDIIEISKDVQEKITTMKFEDLNHDFNILMTGQKTDKIKISVTFLKSIISKIERIKKKFCMLSEYKEIISDFYNSHQKKTIYQKKTA